MTKNYLLIPGLVFLILSGCSSRHRLVGRRDLLKYINDPGHGLVQKNAVEDVAVSLSFEPSSLLVAHDLETAGRKDSATINALQRKYSPNYYFLLKLSKNNKELLRQLPSFGDYSEMVEVLSFRMQQYINLTMERDTVAMSDYAYEQTYGMGDANSLLIAFPRAKVGGDGRFDVNLAECGFGIGALKFSFQKKDLDRVPSLDYNRLQ